jgi:hypothetical protein
VRGIPHPAVHMGAALWRYASSKPPFRCWPSVASLAEYMGVSETRVRELLQDLRLAEWVNADRRAGGRRLTNMYELVQGQPVWPTSATVQRRPSRQPPLKAQPSDERAVVDLFQSSDEPAVGGFGRPPVEAEYRPPVEALASTVPTARSTVGEPRNPAMNLSDVAAASVPIGSSVPGLERVAVSKHRHSADARAVDDADATRQDEPRPNPSRAADVRELADRLAHARGIPT